MKQEPFTPTEQEIISNVLKRSLGPEWINQRSGPSGRLTYIEGKTAINLANEIFGFNGWCSEIKDTTVDFVDVTSEGRTNIGVSVTIKITLKDGTFHEDIGYGSSENAKTKASAYEKARKQAVTDATKRALRSFGNALGNCLYDKNYLDNIVRMAKPQIKFTPLGLYRHDQFDTKKQEQLQIQQNEQQRHQQQLQIQQQRQQNMLEEEKKQNQIKHEPPSSHHIQTSTPQANHTTLNKPPSVSTENTSPKEPERPTLLPEDSFSYEGDDEFFVQMIQAEDEFELGLSVKDEIDDPTTGTMKESQKSETEPLIGMRREAPLSDLDKNHLNKRTRTSQ